MPNFLDTFSATLGILLVIEATRRVIGGSMVIICMVGFAYLAFGSFLPSYMAHTGFTFEQVVNFMFFSTEGILGMPLGVSSTVIIIFVIFGAFLLVSGAGAFFIDVGLALFGKFRGGPAKAAVMASCMFGSITGNQVANVTAVGVLTIPLMKRVGYRPIVAASVEALASTGGMLIPPVMGSVAFIIPEMIGGSYWDVCKAALIPGLLFYVSVYMIVELQSAKYGLKGLPKTELPSLKKAFLDRGHMIFPILVLIYCVAIQGTSTPKAGFWAIVACVIASQLRPKTRMNVKKIATALERGAKGSLIVAACCASAGLITGAISMTGLGMRFSDIMITFAGGSMIVLLILTMIASLILGLPLPPVTCYLILAVLAAPALVKAGAQSHGSAPLRLLLRSPREHQPSCRPDLLCGSGFGRNRPDENDQPHLLLLFTVFLSSVPLHLRQRTPAHGLSRHGCPPGHLFLYRARVHGRYLSRIPCSATSTGSSDCCF